MAEDGPFILVSGGAKGVDTMAAEWTAHKGFPKPIIFKPVWKPNGIYDPEAAFKRNRLIAEEAEFMVAFWTGKSGGTLNALNYMRDLDKPLMIVYPDGRIEWEDSGREVSKEAGGDRSLSLDTGTHS